MGELLTALVEGLVAILQLIVEGFVILVSGAKTVILCLCSKRFRAKKRAEWEKHKTKKYVELIWGSICLTGVIGLAAWLLLSEAKPKTQNVTVSGIEKPLAGEDARLKLNIKNGDGETEFRVVIKEGGTAKILAAKTIDELGKQLTQNLTIVTELTRNRESSVDQ